MLKTRAKFFHSQIACVKTIILIHLLAVMYSTIAGFAAIADPCPNFLAGSRGVGRVGLICAYVLHPLNYVYPRGTAYTEVILPSAIFEFDCMDNFNLV